ncbi:glutamamyl carboxypeptidase [Trypanosoma rangeli]|uniref:Glutamamyl carboxypeptidase n=1 Tax=Trypanosoma rangeli TaxID=5698 RepID=A0A3S5IRT4_TRYRA|nr:glutamamyl carboxypeptidase [Trypanosoma rangeli]RNF08699.1 glutamamyl carboxypeptidase [Trypanosoma rangeli]|eukprot:RNF08699.1 glutamamyl carboxypeptidase [Trypanosoma rangeli]
MGCILAARADEIEGRIKAHTNGILVPAAKKVFKGAHIELKRLCNASFFELINEKKLFTIFLLRLIKDSATRKVVCGTEGGQYQGIGVLLVVVCGPGSILQAHKANEFVVLEQLKGCVSIVRAVARGDGTLASPHL